MGIRIPHPQIPRIMWPRENNIANTMNYKLQNSFLFTCESDHGLSLLPKYKLHSLPVSWEKESGSEKKSQEKRRQRRRKKRKLVLIHR